MVNFIVGSVKVDSNTDMLQNFCYWKCSLHMNGVVSVACTQILSKKPKLDLLHINIYLKSEIPIHIRLEQTIAVGSGIC